MNDTFISGSQRQRISYAEIVDLSRDANLSNQTTPPAVLTYATRRLYAEQFQTVRIDIGRNVGKTRYICQHAGPNDVIIAHSWEAKRWYNDHTNTPVITAGQLMQHNGAFCQPARIVYVDEPSLMTNSQLCAIYERFSTSIVEQFVLLG